jgi:hypothetical protein
VSSVVAIVLPGNSAFSHRYEKSGILLLKAAAPVNLQLNIFGRAITPTAALNALIEKLGFAIRVPVTTTVGNCVSAVVIL